MHNRFPQSFADEARTCRHARVARAATMPSFSKPARPSPSKRKQRAKGVNLSDEDADQIFEEHIKASELSVEAFCEYPKLCHSKGPSWKHLHKKRAMLADILARARGKLLKMVKREEQT